MNKQTVLQFYVIWFSVVAVWRTYSYSWCWCAAQALKPSWVTAFPTQKSNLNFYKLLQIKLKKSIPHFSVYVFHSRFSAKTISTLFQTKQAKCIPHFRPKRAKTIPQHIPSYTRMVIPTPFPTGTSCLNLVSNFKLNRSLGYSRVWFHCLVSPSHNCLSNHEYLGRGVGS